ncbi:putative lipoprotein [Aliiruegeria haliotis]|uniref:Putative lipoprotein n=1 Tax=Aliiruegeria haliotis TaxID=1280846 RepID=A0A2T0RW19_9RHOB|nr:YbaY family lipoprotein [Aliiruegeria haliotis]PRY25389.1 putative lipoprotein [Aliiruegeria haliotis]
MRRLILATLALLLAPTLAAADMLTGTVTYLQRIMPPPGAVLEVTLQDISLADAPAKELATFTKTDLGGPPYRFAFKYDPATINPSNSYALRATITKDGALWMTTDTVYPVLTRGGGTEAEMILKMVAGMEESSAKPNSDFVNTYWKIETLGGEAIPAPQNSKREGHIILRADGNYSATVGCNMIQGGYAVDGAKVDFKPGPMTMMACVPPWDTLERTLVEVLGSAASFGISGETMELVDPAGGTLATFRAVYF